MHAVTKFFPKSTTHSPYKCLNDLYVLKVGGQFSALIFFDLSIAQK
jgi:hypothetical protein